MKITEIAFSSYPVTDITKARAFYEGVLGLKVTMENNMGNGGHWIEYDIGATTLGGQAQRQPFHAGTPRDCDGTG